MDTLRDKIYLEKLWNDEMLLGEFGRNKCENTYHKKSVLVTGHTGFKGSWLCEWLLKLGAEVHGYSEGIPSDPSLFSDNSLSDRLASTTFADVRDRDDLNNFVDSVDPDFIFHLAAQPIVSQSILDPTRTIETNVLGVSNILDCVRIRRKPCSLVVITSDKCYENLEWVWGYRENDRMGGKDPGASKVLPVFLLLPAHLKTNI